MQLLTSFTLLLTLCLVTEVVMGWSARSEEDRRHERERSEEERSEEDRKRHERERSEEDRSEEDKRHWERSEEDRKRHESDRSEEEKRHGEERRHNEDRSEEELGKLEMLFRQLRGAITTRSRGSCKGNKCESGSQCRSAETPLAKIGIMYTCHCPRGKGGYFCGVDKPCESCPSGTTTCLATNMSKEGKFCYDSKYNLLNSITSRNWEEEDASASIMKRGYIGYEDLE